MTFWREQRRRTRPIAQPTCRALVDEAGDTLRPRRARPALASAHPGRRGCRDRLAAAALGAVLAPPRRHRRRVAGRWVVASTGLAARRLRRADRAEPTHVAVESGRVWFSTSDTVWRLDPASDAGQGGGGRLRPPSRRPDGKSTSHATANRSRASCPLRRGHRLEGRRRLDSRVQPVRLARARLWAAGCPNGQQLGIEPNRITKGPL